MLEGNRTFIAIATALVAKLAEMAGMTIDMAGQTALVNSLVMIVGMVAAVWFKHAANKREAALKAQVAQAQEIKQ